MTSVRSSRFCRDCDSHATGFAETRMRPGERRLILRTCAVVIALSIMGGCRQTATPARPPRPRLPAYVAHVDGEPSPIQDPGSVEPQSASQGASPLSDQPIIGTLWQGP